MRRGRYLPSPGCMYWCSPPILTNEVLGAGGQFADMRHLSLVHLTDGVPTHREAWRRGWPTRGSYARAVLHAPATWFHFRGSAKSDGQLCGRCRLLPRGGQPLWEMASYHAAAAHVGEPHAATGRILTAEVAAGVFLDPPSADIHEVAVRLSPAACAAKRRMLACFASGRRQLEEFGFDPAIERFRPAPRYDFGRSPHPGVLLYETQRWAPMTSVRWCSAAFG